MSLQVSEPKIITLEELDNQYLDKIKHALVYCLNKVDSSDTPAGLEDFEQSLRGLVAVSRNFCRTREKLNRLKELEPIINTDSLPVFDI